MMDRRTLLAILLASVVVIIFQVFFFQPARRPAVPADTTRALAEPPPAAPPVGEEAAPGLREAPELWSGPPASGGPQSYAEVRTPDYHAVFSNQGGVLKKFTLLRFPGRDSEPVEMVRDSLQGELGMTLLTARGAVDLTGARFDLQESENDTSRTLTYSAVDSAGLRVVRRYTLPKQGYTLRHEITIEGPAALGDGADYQVEWSGGLPISEAAARTDMGAFASLTFVGENLRRDGLGSMKPGARHEYTSEAIHWTAVRNKYFISAIAPVHGDPVRVVTFGDREAAVTGTRITMPVLPGQPTRHEFLLYVGPLDYHNLSALGVGLERAVDLGWSAFRWLAVLALEFLVRTYKLIPNYGWLIVILSALTKVVFYPLTRSSLRSMAALHRLKPQMDELRTKYKDDPKRMNQAVMDLYRKNRVNPMGGCLPVLVQLPVFVALYGVFANSVELRRAPFALWVNDLSAPDTVGHIMGFPINILPLIMTGTTILQQKLTPTDPRQAAMAYMMPVVMLIFFYSFPSGLVIYWTVNNVLQVAQQWWINRHEPALVPVEMPGAARKDPRRRRS